jgi:CheY-like chemotaxis protein
MNQSLMKHLLSYWNFDFDIVNNGKEALDALQQREYRLLLMDIQMPLMDGYTTTLKIRNELGMNIPIIAMTAHAMTGEREKCLSYGMSEYISKPIREKELFGIMNHLMKTNGEQSGTKNENMNMPVGEGEFLDLDYLKEISEGNAAFEIGMIRQFLNQVPGELESMKEAFTKTNYTELALIAHNLKTSVSFLGLTNKLDRHLDFIENNAGNPDAQDTVQEEIMIIHDICERAFLKAKDYLRHLQL